MTPGWTRIQDISSWYKKTLLIFEVVSSSLIMASKSFFCVSCNFKNIVTLCVGGSSLFMVSFIRRLRTTLESLPRSASFCATGLDLISSLNLSPSLGFTNLSMLMNSSMLFWIGDPDNKSLLLVLNSFTYFPRFESWFFRRCPSSRIRIFGHYE